jgi:hypothetical protein
MRGSCVRGLPCHSTSQFVLLGYQLITNFFTSHPPLPGNMKFNNPKGNLIFIKLLLDLSWSSEQKHSFMILCIPQHSLSALMFRVANIPKQNKAISLNQEC